MTTKPKLRWLPCWLMAAGIGGTAARAAGTTAVSAHDFLNSIGVCVHVQHGQDAAKMVAPLKYLGVRNVRDGADRNYDMTGLLALHQQTGVLVAFGPGSGPSDRYFVRRGGATNNALTATLI